MKRQATLRQYMIHQKQAAILAVVVFIIMSIAASIASYYMRSAVPLTFVLVAVVMAIREVRTAAKYDQALRNTPDDFQSQYMTDPDKESCDVPSHNSDHVRTTRRQGFSHRENRHAYEVE